MFIRFRENEPGCKGKRIHPTKVREKTNGELLHSLLRKFNRPR
jgi:hypothetical protein